MKFSFKKTVSAVAAVALLSTFAGSVGAVDYATKNVEYLNVSGSGSGGGSGSTGSSDPASTGKIVAQNVSAGATVRISDEGVTLTPPAVAKLARSGGSLTLRQANGIAVVLDGEALKGVKGAVKISVKLSVREGAVKAEVLLEGEEDINVADLNLSIKIPNRVLKKAGIASAAATASTGTVTTNPGGGIVISGIEDVTILVQ